MFTNIPLNFWLENAHFVVFILVTLGFLAAAWLNLDSYLEKRDPKIGMRTGGFFFLALWALSSASGLDLAWVERTTIILELLGIAFLALGFYIEEAPVVPKGSAQPTRVANGKMAFLGLPWVAESAIKLPLVLWIATLIRIWRFATVGLINDFLGLRTALLLITASRIVSLAEIFRSTDNVLVFNLTREYSYLWGLENLLMLVGAFILIRWGFFYLRFRPTPKLFLSFISTGIIILVVATVSFTYYLFSVSQKNSLDILKKSAAVFEYSTKELERQTQITAYSLAQRQEVIDAAVVNSSSRATTGLGDPINDLKVGGAIVTNRSGEVLAVVGSNVEVGDSLVDDAAVSKTLQGTPTDSLVQEKPQDVSQIIVRSAYPIVEDRKVAGVVVVDYPIDQSFVDHVKEVTGLDVSVNYGQVRVATTFEDKNSRRITGTQITNDDVKKLIIEKTNTGWVWSGSERLVDQLYLTSYRSLSNNNGVNIGSLTVGQDKNDIIDQLNRSISLTFLTTSILILLILAPLYFVSKTVSAGTKV